MDSCLEVESGQHESQHTITSGEAFRAAKNCTKDEWILSGKSVQQRVRACTSHRLGGDFWGVIRSSNVLNVSVLFFND